MEQDNQQITEEEAKKIRALLKNGKRDDELMNLKNATEEMPHPIDEYQEVLNEMGKSEKQEKIEFLFQHLTELLPQLYRGAEEGILEYSGKEDFIRIIRKDRICKSLVDFQERELETFRLKRPDSDTFIEIEKKKIKRLVISPIHPNKATFHVEGGGQCEISAENLELTQKIIVQLYQELPESSFDWGEIGKVLIKSVDAVKKVLGQGKEKYEYAPTGIFDSCKYFKDIENVFETTNSLADSRGVSYERRMWMKMIRNVENDCERRTSSEEVILESYCKKIQGIEFITDNQGLRNAVIRAVKNWFQCQREQGLETKEDVDKAADILLQRLEVLQPRLIIAARERKDVQLLSVEEQAMREVKKLIKFAYEEDDQYLEKTRRQEIENARAHEIKVFVLRNFDDNGFEISIQFSEEKGAQSMSAHKINKDDKQENILLAPGDSLFRIGKIEKMQEIVDQLEWELPMEPEATDMKEEEKEQEAAVLLQKLTTFIPRLRLGVEKGGIKYIGAEEFVRDARDDGDHESAEKMKILQLEDFSLTFNNGFKITVMVEKEMVVEMAVSKKEVEFSICLERTRVDDCRYFSVKNLEIVKKIIIKLEQELPTEK